MALRIVSTSALFVSAAADINLALSDCGDSTTKGHVTSLSPTTVPQGTKTRVVGQGSVDVDVTGGTFHAEVKALGVLLKSCDGDFCAEATCDLPQGTGSITLGGLDCPQAAGDVNINFDVTVSASIPSQLAVLELGLTATSNSGDSLMCAKINTSPAGVDGIIDPSDPNGLGCDVIGSVCTAIFASAATSALSCTEDSALVVGACEAALLGFEDPLADACAALLGGVCEVSCVAAVAAGGAFSAHDCKKAAGCNGDLIV